MQIIKAPDDKLRLKSRQVKHISSELTQIAKQMIKLASSFKDPEGVGLAAPQIGRSEAFFVAKLKDKFEVFFNPQIISFSAKTKLFFEGCLSIPDYYGEVSRPLSVRVSYQNSEGQTINRRLTNTQSLIFQHEYDHLLGKLFIDYVLAQKGRLFKYTGKDAKGKDIFEPVDVTLA